MISLLSKIKEKFNKESTHVPENTPESKPSSMADSVRKIAAQRLQERLDQLPEGTTLRVLTPVGDFQGIYIGGIEKVSENRIEATPHGKYMLKTASWSLDSVVLETPDEQGGVLDIYGKLHKGWVVLPKESIHAIKVTYE